MKPNQTREKFIQLRDSLKKSVLNMKQRGY